MIIERTKSFKKQYGKLPIKQKRRFDERVRIFAANPFYSELRNHSLKGKYLGYRSIDITGDLRALYTVKGDKIIIFAFIGSHSQLYG